MDFIVLFLISEDFEDDVDETGKKHHKFLVRV